MTGTSLPVNNVIILTPFRANQYRKNSVGYGDVYTLMWRKEGRSLDHVMRLGDDVGILANDSQPSPSAQKLNYWPNRQFGLNGRTLVVVTKEVGSFVIFE